MVLTDREDLAMAVRELRAYDGALARSLRFNCKMADLAASLARVQLRHLPEFVARRRALAKLYNGVLQMGRSKGLWRPDRLSVLSWQKIKEVDR